MPLDFCLSKTPSPSLSIISAQRFKDRVQYLSQQTHEHQRTLVYTHILLPTHTNTYTLTRTSSQQCQSKTAAVTKAAQAQAYKPTTTKSVSDTCPTRNRTDKKTQSTPTYQALNRTWPAEANPQGQTERQQTRLTGSSPGMQRWYVETMREQPWNNMGYYKAFPTGPSGQADRSQGSSAGAEGGSEFRR